MATPELTIRSYLNESGELATFFPYHITDDVLLKGYKTMLLTRMLDRQMIILQRQGVISFAMSSLGEEACSVASAAALGAEDWIYPQYRENGVLFWRGFPIAQYVHQMFCDGKDLLHGRQMPNHFGSRALNVVHVSSPIGTKIPHAAGSAYAMKLQKENTIAICYFGEGAVSEGDFHVGVNFAAVRKVPAIFFCRNNGYAISTPSTQQCRAESVAFKGIGYGITALRVDGNDFFAVYAVVMEARKMCLEGKGPILIEALTYRMGAHSTSDDPSIYRLEDEENEWKLKDPILRLKRYLEKRGLWNDEREDALVKEIAGHIEAAVAEAKLTPRPNSHSLIEDVYFDVPRNLAEQYEQWVDDKK